MPKEQKQKGDVKAVLDRQLVPDRHELKTAYVNTFEMIKTAARERTKCGKQETATQRVRGRKETVREKVQNKT